MQRWIHPEKHRYYLVDLVQDLLGDWTLVLCWGGIGSRRGRLRVVGVASEAEGLARIEAIARRRQQRGYRRPMESASTRSEPRHPGRDLTRDNAEWLRR